MAVYSFSTRSIKDQELLKEEKKRHKRAGTNFSKYIIDLVIKDIESRNMVKETK